MGTPRILVVEDEVLIARDILETLESLGYEVIGSARNARDAFSIIVTVKPDLVLMDIQLEGAVDGIEVASMIREQYKIPVVFLTAFANDEVIQRAKITEPFGYILKPFNERELRINIEIGLYKHRMEQERARLKNEISMLRKMLPICSRCKKIRDDEGYWHNVENYLKSNAGMMFSHGLCPDCIRDLYPEFVDTLPFDEEEV